jgi:crotonobetaine/carnitine-CoA ligase
MEYITSGDFTFKKYVGRERNLKFIIEDKAAEKPEYVKLLYGGEKVTYDQLNRRSNSLAHSFLEIGEGKGSHVAVMFNNCPQIIYSWIGLSKIGAIWVPTNPSYKGHMLSYTLNHSDSTTLITRYEYLERLIPIKDELPMLKNIVVYPEMPGEGESLAELPFAFYSFKEFLGDGSSDNPNIEVLDRDIMAISYTSGTTGDPKGCLQYQAQAYRFTQDTILLRIHEGVFRRGDIILNVLPFFHNAGVWGDFYTSISLDLPMATVDFSASRFWKDVCDYKATYCYLLGTMAGILLRTAESPYEKDNTLRSCTYVPFNNEVEAFKKRFGISIMATSWGISEGHVSFGTVNPPKVTIGRRLPKHKGCVAVIGEDGMECSVGKPGEICLRPDPEEPWELFAGYYKDAEETVKTMRNFMLHTGDMAYRDEEGYYVFVDRMKHAIRRGGENISSVRIEMSISEYERVAECAVVAVPSEISEDEIKAYIVAKQGQAIEVRGLVKYLDSILPYFMVPRYYEIVDVLPKTPTEKIRKGVLQGQGLTGREIDIKQLGIKLRSPLIK